MVSVVDANGDPLPEGTSLYLHVKEENNTFSMTSANREIDLDEDGIGEFDIRKIGDNKTKINATLRDNDWEDGNRTDGEFNIEFPNFISDPEEIFVGISNEVTITALDHEDNPIQGVNITLWGIGIAQPDPQETDSDGKVKFSVEPLSSGIINITIARNIRYVSGALMWDNAIITDKTIVVGYQKSLTITVSKSPIYEGETLTVTVKSGTTPIEGASIQFGTSTYTTDSNGEATITVPDPKVESAIYIIIAEKSGYITAEKSITLLKKYEITIIGPSTAPATGETFTVTILAKGAALAGATVTIEGDTYTKTYTSSGDGKLTITAPSKEGDYTITATYEDLEEGTITIKIKAGGIPGFELLTLIVAIGVAFILLRRRRN